MVVDFPPSPHMKLTASLLVLLIAIALIGACKRPGDIKTPNSEAASATASIQNELKLSIPVPVSSGIGKKEIFFLASDSPHFHILLTNTSQKPINIWRDWCSW